MAVLIKKKVQPVATEDELSQRQLDTLYAVGLGSAPKKLSVAEQVQAKKVEVFSEGQKVIVTNHLYPWIEHWKPGDTGVVKKYHPPIKECMGDRRYACVVVRLDKPRNPNKVEAYFHAWELEGRPA